MSRRFPTFIFLFFAVLWLGRSTSKIANASESSNTFDPTKVEFFEKKIRPLLIENCINCHSEENGGKGNLRVDDRNGLIEGGGRGPAIKPGKPEASLLIKAVRHKGPSMPPNKQLTDEQIGDLEKWILDGAAWPATEVPDDLTKPKPEYDDLKRNHWSWQPIKQVVPPQVANESFVLNGIDRFILAKLNEACLQPVQDADKLSLIRRVTFDLTGLPPTPEEITKFVDDAEPNAFEKVVDRLLKSPAFGERWGRHWLDIARYGESSGSARNIPFPHAWRYRDYVIESFTSDKPYDQFIREQIAGDLLPANSPAEKADQLVATGFLAIGVKDVNQRFKVRFTMDNIDEQIDTVSRSILGLTASCARCHDHKFDPIPTVDYYALAGIFHSSDLCAGVKSKMGGGGLDYYDSSMLLHVGTDSKPDPMIGEKMEAAKTAYEKAKAEFEAIRGKPEGLALGPNGRPKQQAFRLRMDKAQKDLFALTDPAVTGKVAYGVREAKKIGDTEVRVRGEAEKIGPSVPRGFLSTLEFPDQPKVNPNQSGRLELAQWLTSEKNPLTQRVIVNRIWQHLFQQGIVTTVDNFGTTGDRPSHPELLDYLSKQFVEGGWSIKKLVRTVVLSHTYRLSAESTAANFAVDPANRLVWRHSPRRLDAEEIRDAALAASGKLNLTRPEGSLAKDFKVMEMRNNGPEARGLIDKSSESVHRSVFLPLVRGVTPRALEVFDFAEQGLVTGSRDSTTVPTQALYLLNDPFVRRQALAFAERLLKNTEQNDYDRVNLAYRLAFGRPATPAEVDRANSYLSEFEAISKETFASAKQPESNLIVDATATPAVTAQAASSDTTGTSQASNQTNTGGAAPTQPVIPANPDDIDPTDAPVKEVVIEARDPKTAAWTSFCQALLGTAEFRYLK
ncbi:MAG: PSD1 and planctomycete cytochrome C domain-containing protein [Schlesneria sp.]